MTTRSIYRPLDVLAGVQPLTDAPALASKHWRSSYHVRFRDGFPEKIGGWQIVKFYRNMSLSGVIRSIFSMDIAARPHAIFGTNTRLYDSNNGQLTNITPLQTASVAAANSLATQYNTLASNPLSTTNGSNTVTIADTQASRLRLGDPVTLSGAAATNGIPAATLNAEHIIRSVGTNNYTIRVATAATATGSGGGASVVRATGLINLTKTAHGQLNGDRVKIAGAATTAGVTAAEINREFEIRNVAANTFDFMTDGTATSAVTGSGGAGTIYYKQLTAGPIDEVALQGYGAGLYGVGLYGTALASNLGKAYPRIWFMDRYGDELITTPGNESGVYRWNGSRDVAPTLVANAPLTVNYSFVSDNILVTFGSDDVENRIAASDQNDITNWVSSSTNQVFRDDIEGAGRLTSHLPLRALNLIFSEDQTYTFRKVPLESGVWEIKQIDPNIGIIAPMARVSVRGVGYWMSKNNFQMYRGANVEIMPSNNPQVPHCTALKYVFDNLNYSQKSKIFAWHNPVFDEIWWHYPSAGSTEPDRIIRVSLADFSWSIDMMDRTAAEYPAIGATYPRLANYAASVFYHEVGNDDDTVPMPFNVTSGYQGLTKPTLDYAGFVPDNILTGSLTVTVRGKLFPQSSNFMFNKVFSITSTTENPQAARNARIWDYTFAGNELNQVWRMGQYQEELQESSTK